MKWFKHFSNASNDEFLAALESEFGLEGVARWWKMLEAIAAQMDETERCWAEYPASKWMTILSCKQQKVLDGFVKGCERFGKIFTKHSYNLLRIECPKLLELRDEYTRKKRKTPEQEVEVDKEGDAESKKVSKKPEPAQAPLFENKPEADFKTVIWQMGLKLIGGEKKRSLMGRWLRDFGEGNVVNALMICEKNKPLDPVEYVEKLLKTGGAGRALGEKPKSDPHRDISNYKVIRD